MPMSPADTTPFQLDMTAFAEGIWQGRLSAPTPAAAPELAVFRDGTRVAEPEITALPGQPGLWEVRWTLPVAALRDGTSVFLITDTATDTVLARLPILAGGDLADDLRGEVALLRAELDQLRAAFQAEARARTTRPPKD
ncbi:hypothetical protein [Dinoroseobacter sp. S375]|uniref:hypothetical protein n=1 Tax=Dinoroseobacter sp. S375 TaxID=3415136 RepID=UPI003C7C3C07